MSPPNILFALVFLLLVFSSIVHGGDPEYQEVDVRTEMSAGTCSSSHHGMNSSNSLKVTHRHGPCSASASPATELLLRKLLDDDHLRVNSLQQLLLQNSTTTADPSLPAGSQISITTRRGIALGTANYVITVGLGTPSRPQTVLFDTGSNVNWFQCKPCTSCHSQKGPIFDPAGSSTYRNLSCSSEPCVLLEQGGCMDGSCPYFVLYGDGSQSAGILSEDVLALTKQDVIRSFVFGCGGSNTGIFGLEAGLFGLGRSPLSLSGQLSTRYGRLFSYCLPPLGSSTGDLTFGPVTGHVSYTPMLTDKLVKSLYFLQLSDISVGGKRLRLSPKLFGTSGTIIDSGTIVTYLPKPAYAALRAAFRSGMRQYKLTKALSILDTCYDLTGVEKVRVPSVALHFGGGVKVNLPFRGIMYVMNASQTCLGFAHTERTAIIGNTQQASRRVVYDIDNLRIGFGHDLCH